MNTDLALTWYDRPESNDIPRPKFKPKPQLIDWNISISAALQAKNIDALIVIKRDASYFLAHSRGREMREAGRAVARCDAGIRFLSCGSSGWCRSASRH